MRLRVEFQDAGLLRASQRLQGLSRCWLQVPPGIVTIADFSAYVHETFGLHHSCPLGLILSVDGFVLPLFVSICILKDEDVIMINKICAVFEDSVIFCDSQNQEKIQVRLISAFKNMNVVSIGTQVDLLGGLGDRSTVHIEGSRSKKMDELCKRKCFSTLHCSNNTLAIKDFQGYSLEDEENVDLDGIIAVHKETSSCEMVAKRKKKYCNKHQTLNVLPLKTSQIDSQGDKCDLDFLMQHKKVSSSEKTKRNVRRHLDRLQRLNDPVVTKDSQGNLENVEENTVLHETIAPDETTPSEMMSSKRKKKNCNKLQTLSVLPRKSSQVDPQRELCDLDFHISHKKVFSCEKTKGSVRRHLDNFQGLNYTMVTKDSQGDLENADEDVEENIGLHGTTALDETMPGELMSSKHKKINCNKLQTLCVLPLKSSQIDSQGELYGLNFHKPHKKLSSSEKTKGNIRRHLDRLQGLNDTMATKDSQGNLENAEEDVEENLGLQGTIALEETMPCEILSSKRKKKNFNKLQTSDTLTNKDSQSDKCDLGLSIPHEETWSSEMIKGNNKRKHFDKLQGSNDSQGNSQRDEEGHGLHWNIPHKKALKNKMMNVRFKTLCFNGSISHKKAANSKAANAKLKRKRSNEIQSYTLTVRKSQEDLQIEDELRIPNGKKARKETPYKLKNAKCNGKHSVKLHNSENETKGFDDAHTSKNCVDGDANKKISRSARRKKAKRLWQLQHGLKKNKERKSLENQNLKDDNQEKALELAKAEQSTAEDQEEVVPVIDRPGHICLVFSDTCVREDKSVETLRWNGTTNKKKGQKWGKEKSFNNWNDDTSILLNNGESSGSKEAEELLEFSNEKSAVEGDVCNKSIFPNQEEPTEECNESKNPTDKEFEPAKQLINFESYLPLVHSPESIMTNQEKALKLAKADQSTDEDQEVVPIIVRPGHICFVYPDTCVREDRSVETLQWNGTTNKKKGQKWGREKSFNKWNDDTSILLNNGEPSGSKEAEELVEFSNENSAVEGEVYNESLSPSQEEPNKECKESENPTHKDIESAKQLIDFESFLPLVRSPEEGDVLVYRLVELSTSSWCPELSAFRVGMVSSYDCSSTKVILLPLPEHPLALEEEMSEEGQESCCLYKEDGTLEVEFSSLVDVRLFNARESSKITPNTIPIKGIQNGAEVNSQKMQNGAAVNSEEMQNGAAENNQEMQNGAPCHAEPENDDRLDGGGWAAINEALNEKKAQLQKQSVLDDEKVNSSLGTTTTGRWSYKALRRNALGPTLALLRSTNGSFDN